MHRPFSVVRALTVAFALSTVLPTFSEIVPPTPDREFRGVWVASVANIDWPSTTGLSAEEQRAEFLKILDHSEKLKLNAIVLQVRPACDALYQSSLEPWSEYLTGEMGKAPEGGFDPLLFAIEQAHQRGMELHAWINPYRARHPTGKSAISDNHISKTRPELVVTYGKHLWLDPGKKEVQDYSLNVILDIVKRYDVDGIHMDDYFYPYREKNGDGEMIDFPDEETFMGYVAEGGLNSLEDWRRDNVNTFIERCYAEIHKVKPFVKFGVSPFGIWQPGYPEQIKGFNAFDELYCDSLKWWTNGWCDYIAPQLYWKIEATAQSYPVLLKWWADENQKGRHLWAGNFTSRVVNEPKEDKEWVPAEIINQITATREQTGASGNIHFSMRVFLENRGKLNDELTNTVYTSPALTPAFPWLKLPAPSKPTVSARRTKNALRLEWKAPKQQTVWQWVVQKRVAGNWTTAIYPAATTTLVSENLETMHIPDAIAVVAVNRAGVASPVAVTEVID